MTQSAASPGTKTSGALKWVLLGGGLLGLFVLGLLLPVRDWIESSRSAFQNLGIAGAALFIAAYAIAAVLMVPGSILTLAAGMIFGLAGGFAVALLGATLGANLAFLVARYVARKPLQAKLETHPKFHAVDQAVEELRYKIVLLLRLSPLVPFNIQNYLFGLTRVKFFEYAWASLVGMAPGTFLYVYLGSTGAQAAEGAGPEKWILWGIGLAATAAATFVVSRKAKEKLRAAGVEAKGPAEPPPTSSPRSGPAPRPAPSASR